MLAEGTSIASESGKHLIVQKLLGRGGRYDIYEVSVKESGERKALKWYRQGYGEFEGKMLENLKLLAHTGSPDQSLLWVEDVVSSPEGSLGYVTDLIPEGYIPFRRLMRHHVLTSEAKCSAALDFLRAFHNTKLHGFLLFTADGADNCYVHPATGHMLIDECERTAPCGIVRYPMIFTARYAAPEVILGKQTQDLQASRFSLAVILFMLLFIGHPLEGKRTLVPIMTPEVSRKIYGEQPLFVFDPEDESNCPVPALHGQMISCWNEAPDYLQSVFRSAFSKEALRDPAARPTERKFEEVIRRYQAELAK